MKVIKIRVHTCPKAAPALPVPSTIPVTVAKASLLSLNSFCFPKSAAMVVLIRLAAPPMKKPIRIIKTALTNLSAGEAEI